MTSVKLSVTVRSKLAAKYGATELAKIDAAIGAWVTADKVRGIQTVHIALDDVGAMRAAGVPALTGRVTAIRAKRAIDALAAKFVPDYIVLVGGDDVLPHFHVPNPSYEPDGDTDQTVATDNPYASSRRYRAGSIKSYLVPDRAIGRIPDLPTNGGTADARWIVVALGTAAAWASQPPGFYANAHATCCDAWSGAGIATMQYLGLATVELMVSPPTVNTTPTSLQRLSRPVHVTKCHGAEFDAHFYGQRGSAYPVALDSTSVAANVGAGTLAAGMCCYGAQVYSPGDPLANPPGAIPLPAAYLQCGAVGYVGATKIAWVGDQVMMCADVVVASYLKKALAGASTGRALMEAKQDYMQRLTNSGQPPDTADEKTMIEFILLGDPSVHPVAAPAPAKTRRGVVPAAPAVSRGQRRLARATVATQVVSALPERVSADTPSSSAAARLFEAVSAPLPKEDEGILTPSRATASKLVAAKPAPRIAALRGLSREAVRSGADSLEYTWTGRKLIRIGAREAAFVRVLMLKVQTDADGNVLRSRLLHSS